MMIRRLLGLIVVTMVMGTTFVMSRDAALADVDRQRQNLRREPFD